MPASFSWLLSSGIAIGLAGVSGVTDYRTGHIPNWTTFPPLIAAPITYGILFGVRGAVISVISAFLCGLLPYIMFRQGGMGGGDVKLFAAIGAVVGVDLGLRIELASMLVGAVYSIIQLGRKGRIKPVLMNAFHLSTNWLLPKHMQKEVVLAESESLRLGTSIFVGSLLAVGQQWAAGQ